MTDQEKKILLARLRVRGVAEKIENLVTDYNLLPQKVLELTGLNTDSYTEHYAIPCVNRDGYLFARA